MLRLEGRIDGGRMVSDRPGDGPDPGLCGRCRHCEEIVSGKGSRFYLCGRSRTDARFPKYPRLPVLRCGGFEPAERTPR